MISGGKVIMKICVFGATGATGQWVTKMLLDKGYHVTVYVRNLNKMDMTHDKLQIVQGDIHNVSKISETLKGQEAVISCLGSSTTKKSSELKDMAKSISKAMEASGVKRIIYMATAGIENEFKGVFKLLIRIMLGNVIDDHRDAAKVYQSGNYNYTIVRPVQLSNEEPTGIYKESFEGLPKSKKAVSRSNVAMFILKALEDRAYDRTSVGLTE